MLHRLHEDQMTISRNKVKNMQYLQIISLRTEDMVVVYCVREAVKGHPYSPDTILPSGVSMNSRG